MAIRRRYARWITGAVLVVGATIFYVLVLVAALWGYLLILDHGTAFQGGKGRAIDAMWWIAAVFVCLVLLYSGMKSFWRWLSSFVSDVADSIEK